RPAARSRASTTRARPHPAGRDSPRASRATARVSRGGPARRHRGGKAWVKDARTGYSGGTRAPDTLGRMGPVRRLAPIVLAALLLAAVAWGAPVAAAETGRTLYVATNGRDFADDGWSVPPNSIDTPWRSIEWAVRRARAGDRIVVRAGTYQEVVGWGALKGTSTRPIRLEAYDGERVTVKGILQFKGADYWIIRRINVVRDGALGRKE